MVTQMKEVFARYDREDIRSDHYWLIEAASKPDGLELALNHLTMISEGLAGTKKLDELNMIAESL